VIYDADPRSTMKIIHILLIAALVSVSIHAAPATQAQTGMVIGKVVDSTGHAVADCAVTAQENARKMRKIYQTTTDKDGKFELKDVPAGDYNINARPADAKGKAVKSVSVTAGETTNAGIMKLRPK
jgi:hypothetical protein